MSEATPLFQQEQSTFVEVTKSLIVDLASAISILEDRMFMEPKQEVENADERIPYRDFRRVFKELFMVTKHRVRNEVLVKAIRVWLSKTTYNKSTKKDDFSTGIDFAEQYIDEMYKIGLLDMNIAEPVDFPFNDILNEVNQQVLQQQAIKQVMMNDSIGE